MASIYGTNFNMYQQYNNYRLWSSMLSNQKITPIKSVSSLNSLNTASGSYRSTQKKSYGYTGGLSADSLSFVKEYQSSMTNMMQAAQKLTGTNAKSALSEMRVSSSDTSVAQASAGWRPSEAASYKLNVKQLASAQQNRSQGVDLSGTDFSGSLQLQTEKGAFQFQTKAGAANNRESLNDLVSQINSAKTGVTASIDIVDGKAALSLTGEKTGEGNGFSVSGSLADAAGMTEAVQEAQNAVYTVQKEGSYTFPKERTSKTNTINVDDAYRINADLKKTGETTVSVTPDTEEMAGALDDLVKSFNSTLKLLNDNADRGTGVLKQMRRMVIPPTSEKSMELVGVTANKDGTLSLDKDAFQQAMQKNPSLVRGIIGGSYGLANGVYTDARQGLNTSSSSLLSEDLKQAQLAAAYNPSNFMATYNRNGVYNMSNFYVSNILMNLMV